MTYAQIAKALDVGYGTAQKYGLKVTLLPKSMRQNPFDLLDPEDNPKQYEKRVINPDHYKDLANKEYWLEDYVRGTPLKAPLHLFSLTELQELENFLERQELTSYRSFLTY